MNIKELQSHRLSAGVSRPSYQGLPSRNRATAARTRPNIRPAFISSVALVLLTGTPAIAQSAPWQENATGDVYRLQGNVGVGTKNPLMKLFLEGGYADLGIALQNTGNGGTRWDLMSHSAGSGNPSGSFVIQDRKANAARMTILPNGHVGLNTNTPLLNLGITGFGGDVGIDLNNRGTGGRPWLIMSHSLGSGNPSGSFVIQDRKENAARFTILPDGRVGLNTNTPDLNLGITGFGGDVGIGLNNRGAGGRQWLLMSHSKGSGNPSGSFVVQDRKANLARLTILENGFVGIGTNTPGSRLEVAGALTITGGSDLVEQFESADEQLVPGTVVVIDSTRKGELTATTTPYDKRVAGVVSGAGGVRPGISLSQQGVLEGDLPVTLLGRTYVLCSAENGPIEPGDRLTTSGIAGHAMKATDPARTDGAVLGKSMGSLKEGTGLVLVLVVAQ